MKKLKVILIGAGGRGIGYTNIMANHPDKYEVVAVAEPLDKRREYVKNKHNIPDNMCFTDWKPLLELGKIADAAIIATMDQDHYAPAVKAIDLKYDLLLEKPISNIASECMDIADRAEAAGVKVVICTVLRYTTLFMSIKHLIKSGRIGDVMSINHEECVGNVHQSHSFVRGNWGNAERSSCMLLQKSCHDTDLLQWLLDKQLKKVQSFGTLSYFTEKNAPDGAPDYCIQGCPIENTCPYNAKLLYLGEHEYSPWFRRAASRCPEPTDADLEEAIANTQYGKCVYKCDNDVVDHQTVNMLFEDDITVTFTMNAFTKGGRFIHIMGTKGEIHAALDGGSPIRVYDFESKTTEEIDSDGMDGITGGHGGGDEGIVGAFYDYVCDCYEGDSIPSIRQAAINHIMVFAAEKSRAENIVVDFDDYLKNFK